VAVFSINHTDGTLTPASGSPFAIGDVYTYGADAMVIGPSGQFLYIPYSYPVGGNPTIVVAAYSIDFTTGALTTVPGGPVPVDNAGEPAATIDPTGKFLYLTSNLICEAAPCVAVSTLAIDAISGALTVTAANSNVGAAFLAFNPSGNLAFGVYLQAVTVYSADPTSGALTALAGGLNFSGVFGIGDTVVVDPSGNFAYLPPQIGTGGSIVILTIDPGTGALTLLPGSPVAVPGLIGLGDFLDVP
jgi:6-phosphogluconolactonase (cycloisomerase 2 family)